MKIVLDTNVIVSGLISPYGNPAEIIRMVSVGEIRLCYDARIITEYKEVLRRPKFQFNPEKIDIILDQIQYPGEIVSSKPLMNSGNCSCLGHGLGSSLIFFRSTSIPFNNCAS